MHSYQNEFPVSCQLHNLSTSERHQCQLHVKRSLVNFESMSHAGGRKTSQPLQKLQHGQDTAINL